MGKKIIIPNSDFAANSIAFPAIVKIKGGESVTINGITYTGGENGKTYELDALPDSLGSTADVNYLLEAKINDDSFILKDAFFQNQQSLEKVSFLSRFNSARSLNNVFYNCSKLSEINGLNNIVTEGVTDFSQMFRMCSFANVDLSSFDTRQANNMSNMLAGCFKLREVNFTSFDTQSVTDMSRILSGCVALETLRLGKKWTMLRQGLSTVDMFYNCVNLTSIYAENCLVQNYGKGQTEIDALIASIVQSGFTFVRSQKALNIICSDGIISGTYTHGEGWKWVVA